MSLRAARTHVVCRVSEPGPVLGSVRVRLPVGRPRTRPGAVAADKVYSDRARGVVSAATELLNHPMDNSVQVLQLIAVLSSEEALAEFSASLGELEPEARQGMTALIVQHENDEWLADERAHGRLRAGETDSAHPHAR